MFGNEILYACYEYLDTFKQEPKDYKMLFEFLKYRLTKDTIRSTRESLMNAMRGG